MPVPEDHPILDGIAERLPAYEGIVDVRRESECVEFYDESQSQFFEVVVRRIECDQITDEDLARLSESGG